MTDVLMPLRRPRSIRTLANRLSGFVRGRLWLQVLVAMALGITSGFMVGPQFDWVSQDTAALVASWAALPGYLFLALVQMIVIPLVVSSIILGMASTENVQQLRQTGVRTGGFFLLTTLGAVLIGLAAVLLIQPGSYMDSSALVMAPAVVEGANSFSLAELPNRITDMVPTNPLRAGVEQNMLQMVVFSILVGAVQDVSMVVVRWAMYLVPFAVFGLMFQLMTRLGLDSLVGLGMYVLTVLTGLLAMLLVYLLLYRLLRRAPALGFMRAARDAQLLAFSTSSSAAVMPLTMQTAIERLNVRQGIAQFVVPLGTTINMAGTALYQVVATVFLAQVFQINIEVSQLVLVVVLAVGASIGSPGTPGIGIVILSMLLTSVGIPAEGIALLIGVDRILDMCRTTLNVTGDLVAAAIMDSWLPASAEDEVAITAPG